jgi:hypothetical protein
MAAGSSFASAAGSSFASALVVVVTAGEGASAAPEGEQAAACSGGAPLHQAPLRRGGARVGCGGALGLDAAAWQRSGRSGEKRGVGRWL